MSCLTIQVEIPFCRAGFLVYSLINPPLLLFVILFSCIHLRCKGRNIDYDAFKVAVTPASHFASKTALRGFGVIMLESPSKEKLGA